MREQKGAFDASRQSREGLGGAAELASGAYTQVGHSVCFKARAPALRLCNGLCKSTCIQFVTTRLLFALLCAKVVWRLLSLEGCAWRSCTQQFKSRAGVEAPVRWCQSTRSYKKRRRMLKRLCPVHLLDRVLWLTGCVL